MGDDWQPGDLALCVNDAPPRESYFRRRGWKAFPLRKGSIHVVRQIAAAENGKIGLLFEGVCAGRYDRTGIEIVFHPSRFRKIRPHTPDAEDRETIALLNGKPAKVTA